MVPDCHINKGVVLAAGDGGRLRPLTSAYPKVLLPVRGKPLICHSIEALVAAGIKEIAVVVGYLERQVQAALGDGSRFGAKLDYILNPNYHGGNAISVKKVRPWTKGKPFVLCMGDHIIEPRMVSYLLDQASSTAEILCADFSPLERQITESTKVCVDSTGCIQHIGKDLIHWDALDTGVFQLTEDFLDAIDELLPILGVNIEISDVIQSMTDKHCRFATCNVSGFFWADVDTEEDLRFVTA